MVVSYLPDRYRRKLGFLDIGDMRTPALISGMLQILACFVLIVLLYPAFVNRVMAGQSMEKAQLGAMEKGGETAVMGFGLVLLAAYLVHPVTLLLEYFLLEGFVRALAALVTGEVVPTLPLVGLAWALGRTQAAAAEKALGPRIVDLVQPGDGSLYDLLIASCRPKEGWDHLMTVSYQEKLYEVTHHEEGNRPRRFLYHLRRKPEGKVVRGLYHYDPAEVLRVEPEEEEGAKISLKERVAKSFQREAPPVADLVEPGDGAEFDLRIASCREKSWDHLITISYEDHLYELAEERPGEPPRPFLYFLRFHPANKVVRRIHRYDPYETFRQT
ncbi:MAG: hypothetical protein ACRD3A_03345 [Terriglobales bacterium]